MRDSGTTRRARFVLKSSLRLGYARVTRVTLRFSAHASQRMKSRRITQAEVEEALADPGRVRYPSADYPSERLVILGDTSAGRRLKIVVPVDDNETVITVADRDSGG